MSFAVNAVPLPDPNEYAESLEGRLPSHVPNRKMARDITQCFKRIMDGVADVHDCWRRMGERNQPDAHFTKWRTELKKDIKRLQRQRDLVRTWSADPTVQDAGGVLAAARRAVEVEMERMRTYEREARLKDYSADALARPSAHPADEAKAATAAWVRAAQASLAVAAERLAADADDARAAGRTAAAAAAEDRAAEHEAHVARLDQVLRGVETEVVGAADANALLRDAVEAYVATGGDVSAPPLDDEVYEGLGLDALESVGTLAMHGGPGDRADRAAAAAAVVAAALAPPSESEGEEESAGAGGKGKKRAGASDKAAKKAAKKAAADAAAAAARAARAKHRGLAAPAAPPASPPPPPAVAPATPASEAGSEAGSAAAAAPPPLRAPSPPALRAPSTSTPASGLESVDADASLGFVRPGRGGSATTAGSGVGDGGVAAPPAGRALSSPSPSASRLSPSPSPAPPSGDAGVDASFGPSDEEEGDGVKPYRAALRVSPSPPPPPPARAASQVPPAPDPAVAAYNELLLSASADHMSVRGGEEGGARRAAAPAAALGGVGGAGDAFWARYFGALQETTAY